MHDPTCDNLDAYLLQELEGDSLLSFRQHLTQCETCRESLQQQADLDRLLQLNADRLAAATRVTDLAERVESRIVRHRRRSRTIGIVTVLVPTVVCAILFWSRPENTNRSSPQQKSLVQTEAEQTPIENIPEESVLPSVRTEVQADPPQVQVSGDVVALEIESGDPTITIIQIYPTVRSKGSL